MSLQIHHNIIHNKMGKLDIIRSKILPEDCIRRMLAYWRFRNYRIVFTNGCFDILHLGHIDYLARASDLGDLLVVGMNTDRSVRAIKGPPRPLQDEKSRSLLLASLSFVGAVILFDQDTPAELIGIVQPDILVKGSDYKPEEIAGYDIVTAKGGTVVSLDLVEGYSTTGIVNRLSG
jgi:D-glycero-beta-D-manno-heptose 1-phosphate adenylyltransferase